MKRTFWKKALTFALSAALAVSVGSVALAEETQSTQPSMTIEDFEKAVVAAGGTYDGNGVTITWSPSSGCFYGQSVHNCLFGDVESKSPDGNTPDRIQKPYAQYQLFEKLGDVSISNVNFVCVQPESAIILCKNSDWKGTLDPATVKKIMAEIQCINTGNTSFTNCTFDNVTISPFGSGEGDRASFESCGFSNVDRYAIKDIYAQNATVNNCSFNDCNGAIYFEGSTPKGNLSITNNSFSNIAERGMIQFSKNGDYSNAKVVVTGNTGNVEALFRELNNSIQSVIYDNPDLAFQKSKTDDSKKELLTASVGNKYYSSLNDAIKAIGSQEATVTLGADCTENVEIPTGANITIDLNGHNITNKDNDTIKNKGNLTITGNGTVDNVTHGKAALYNDVGAVAVLNGGKFTRSHENGIDAGNNGGNSFYTLKNFGTLTINDGVTVNQDGTGNGGTVGKYSSLIANGWQAYGSSSEPSPIEGKTAALIINGGTFSGGLNTIKNDDNAELTINGGTFTNYTQCAFMNHHIATVNGGTFNAESYYSIYNCGCAPNIDIGKLTITGGTFTGALRLADQYDDVSISGGTFIGSIVKSKQESKLAISGGKFSTDVQTYCADGYFSVPNDDKTEWSVQQKKRELVVKMNDISVENGKEPVFTYAVAGLAKDDKVTVNPVCKYDSTVAGTYKIDATVTDTPVYYETPAVVSGALTVLPKPGTETGTTDTVVVPEVPKVDESANPSEEAKKVAYALVVDEEAVALNGVAVAKELEASGESMKEAEEKLADVRAEGDTILLVVKPYVEIKPTTIETSADGKVQKVNLEITMKYDVQATIPGKKTVEISTGNTMSKEQIKADTTITVPVPTGFATTEAFVRHVTGDNNVYYYSTKLTDGKFEFTVPAEHGFSPFTLMSNSNVTVKLDGKDYTYTSLDVVNGTALPAASKYNYAFKGWKFEGVDGQYSNMTAELFEALLDKNAVVIGSSVFEGPLSEHPEIEEAKKNGTWGVDENKPAATAKPAAAAAVTPVRSSIPKTSDDSNLMLWVCLMGLAVLGLGGALYLKKRNHQ